MNWMGQDLGNFGKPSKPSKVVKCWHKHPTYYIDGMPIIGGSCVSHYPDIDLFIGFDYSIHGGHRSYPWVDGVDIYFHIPDMGVPKSITDFRKLIEYTAQAMKDGKSVYAGCFGGHGRTGLFLAALTTHITGNKESITLVRKEYCKKAVESTKQVEWLHKHFGITKIPSSKGSALNLVSPKDFGNGDKFLTHSGVTEAPKSKYHCIKGKSIFECK